MATTDEIRALLQTPDGQAFIESLNFHLGIERYRDTLALDIANLANDIQPELIRAVNGRLQALGIRDQTQAFRQLVDYKVMTKRVGEVVTKMSNRTRDALLDGLAERLGSNGLGRVALRNFQIQGRSVADLFRQWRGYTQQNILRRISAGLAEGQKPEVILRQVQLAMERARRDLRTVAHTISVQALGLARERRFAQQGIKKVRYVAVLDGRTTQICTSLAGRVFPLYSGPRPPQHFNCRSFIMPATNNLRALGRIKQEDLELALGTPLERATLARKPTLGQIVRQQEDVIVLHKNEHGMAFDGNGNVLGNFTSGSPEGIEIDDRLIADWARRGDVTFTHNHPVIATVQEAIAKGEIPANGLGSKGNSLSIEDIRVARLGNVVEMRAVSPGFRYSLKAGPAGWPGDRELLPHFDRVYFQVYDDLLKKLDAARGTPDYVRLRDAFEFEFSDRIVRSIAERFGLVYRVESR